jgi:hypothetical protein
MLSGFAVGYLLHLALLQFSIFAKFQALPFWHRILIALPILGIAFYYGFKVQNKNSHQS